MRTLSIKNSYALILIFLSFIACNSPEKISGKLEGPDKQNKKIYLIEPGSLKEVAASFFGKILDSAEVNSEGNFEFQNLPETEQPVLLEVVLKQPGKSPTYLQNENPEMANYMPVIWQSGKSLQITAKVDDFQKSFSIERPSEMNKALLDLRDIKQKAYQNYLAGKHWKVEDGSQLLEKEHAILEYQKQLIKFADSTQYFIPAMLALRWVSPRNDYERIPEFLVRQCNKWQKQQEDHPWIEQLCEQSKPSNLPVLVGDKFPNLKIPTLSTDTISIKNHLGNKLTIIDLWASWCAPCRKENRDILVPLWDEYHEQGLQIIGYGLESDESAWKAAAKRDGADRWLQASDLQGDDAPFLKKIRVKTIPANFILDDKGVVIAKNVHGKVLKDLVENYITRK